MKKIVILFTNYGPYHFARLEGACRATESIGWESVGIELSRIESTYAWRTSAETIPPLFRTVISDKTWEEVSLGKLTLSLYRVLSEVKPDIIAIPGYHLPVLLMTVVWAKLNDIKVILMIDSKEDDAVRHFFPELIKRVILKLYDAVLAAGSPQKRYLLKLGVSQESIFTGYDVVDNNTFSRKDYTPPIDKPFFLSVNRFIPKKNLLTLLSAYSDYRKRSENELWDLVMVGDGELKLEIENKISDLGLEKCIHLPGFLQRNEQLPYFAHAKCFVHASLQEQWGLVVNEAMASGLPVLVSYRCGCFQDLIFQGKTGFGFNPDSKFEITDLMVKMSSGDVDLQALGQNAMNHISGFSPDHFGENLVKASIFCLENS